MFTCCVGRWDGRKTRRRQVVRMESSSGEEVGGKLVRGPVAGC